MCRTDLTSDHLTSLDSLTPASCKHWPLPGSIAAPCCDAVRLSEEPGLFLLQCSGLAGLAWPRGWNRVCRQQTEDYGNYDLIIMIEIGEIRTFHA